MTDTDGISRSQTPEEIGREHLEEMLILVARLRWVTVEMVRWWIWPTGPDSARQLAYGLLARAEARGLLLRRCLSGRRNAFVLTKLGAAATPLEDVRPGTDWGRFVDGIWQPPQSVHHEERAARFFIAANRMMGWECFSELEGRAVRPAKEEHYPDFIVMNKDGTCSWGEVEHARKGGRYAQRMVWLFESIFRRSVTLLVPNYGRVRVTGVIVVYDPEQRDTRIRNRNRIHHRKGIEKRVSELQPDRPIAVTFLADLGPWKGYQASKSVIRFYGDPDEEWQGDRGDELPEDQRIQRRDFGLVGVPNPRPTQVVPERDPSEIAASYRQRKAEAIAAGKRPPRKPKPPLGFEWVGDDLEDVMLLWYRRWGSLA